MVGPSFGNFRSAFSIAVCFAVRSFRYHCAIQIRRLITALNASDRPIETNDLIRSLTDRIVFTPDKARKRLKLDLFGDLPGICQIAKPLEMDRPHCARNHKVAAW